VLRTVVCILSDLSTGLSFKRDCCPAKRTLPRLYSHDLSWTVTGWLQVLDWKAYGRLQVLESDGKYCLSLGEAITHERYSLTRDIYVCKRGKLPFRLDTRCQPLSVTKHLERFPLFFMVRTKHSYDGS